MLRHGDEPRVEHLRADPVLGPHPAVDAVGQRPALGRPLGEPRVEPVHQAEVGADVEHGQPLHRFPYRIEQGHAQEAAVGRAVPDLGLALQVPRELTADLDAVHLVGAGVDVGQQRFLEHHRAHADRARHEEDRQARPVEAHARRLHRVQLALAGEGEEEEDGRDQHDHRQALVELVGQPVDEVLEDGGERRLDPQETVERLEQVHHADEHRADEGADPQVHQVLADQVAVHDEARLPRAGEAPEVPPAPLLERLRGPGRAPRFHLGPEAPEELEPRGGDAGHARPQHGEPHHRQDRVRDPHRDAGGHAAAQGEALHRRVEDVVRDHDAEREAERHRPPAAVAADAEGKSHQREHEGGHRQGEALVQLHVVRGDDLPGPAQPLRLADQLP